MARPREFDLDKAVADAKAVFWMHGYQDASLPDLLAGMGLTRGSLYKAFKDKKNLYLAVLDHYERAEVDKAVRWLTDPNGPDGSQRIFTVFENVCAAVAGGDQRGCLLCTAAAGTEMEDAEIARAVHIALGKMRDGFQSALHASARHTEHSRTELEILAQGLLTQYVGLRVLARANLPQENLKQSAENIRRLLG